MTIEPDADNGLQKPLQVMIDKAVTLPRAKIRQRIGRLDATALENVNAALARFLGLV